MSADNANATAQQLDRSFPRSWPESTYRLQFHANFRFSDAVQIVPYLRDLGVTHIYASPYLKAAPGSVHGYDIVDHRVLNPEIGTPEEHEEFVKILQNNGLGLILDIVPNHMGVATNENEWWNNVLENGPSSKFADYFDIAWAATTRPELKDKVLLPVLGEPYGKTLEAGQIRLSFDSGSFTIHYFTRYFPVAPRSYLFILSYRQDDLQARLGPESEEYAEYQSILTAIRNLPDRTETDPSRIIERQREKEIIKRRLGELVSRSNPVKEFVEENVVIFNGSVGDPRSFDRLDDLLNHQAHRLSYWRVALEEINYRRFFDINDLAALSVERQEVFSAVHETIFQLIERGCVDGLRIDHPDGLYNPREYLDRLHATGNKYIVVEKILGAGETLPRDWDCAGTTGYEFLNFVNGLFIDRSAEIAFTRLYQDLCEESRSFSEIVYRSKRQTLLNSLAGELNALAYQLDRLAQRRRHSRDFTFVGLRAALIEVISCFPVYRSYISGDAGVSEDDRTRVELAIRRAGTRNPLLNKAIFRFLKSMILLDYPENSTDKERDDQIRFSGKFQQVTSPVMAKGLEDTAFYVYNRFVSLNEVGGHPGIFGVSPEELHSFFGERQRRWPYSLSPLSTHDTKRSEDVRARINSLSEMPSEWEGTVREWKELNAIHRIPVGESLAPDANEEYLIYQTLIGVWPTKILTADEILVSRISEYMIKALHEAKIHSSWLNPHSEYDDAIALFIRRILDPRLSESFLQNFVNFVNPVARYSTINTLSQSLLKITAPGAADTYQGTELPDFSLVDPDNRRPVDFRLREKMLREFFEVKDAKCFCRKVIQSGDSERAKLYLTWKAMGVRRKHPGLFTKGNYYPLTCKGTRSQHVFAFARELGSEIAIIGVPRISWKFREFEQPWLQTSLDLSSFNGTGVWQDIFSGQERQPSSSGLLIQELFADFPVALLVRQN